MEPVVFDALASPRRREILRLVWTEEQTAGAIHKAMPDVTFGAISLQLRQLSEAGLVEARTESRNRFYRARREALGAAAEMLEAMWGDALWKLKLAAELEHSRRGPKQVEARSKKRSKPKREN
ncbi:MAG: helix-turn-helix domain-containing protein [Acidobacteriota bacterium]